MKPSYMVLKGIAAAALIGLAGNAAAKEFRSSDVHPNDYPTVRAVGEISRILSEKTSGKYTVKVFGSSALGSEKDTVEQVKLGALDMVRVNTAAFNNIVAETVVPALPFIFKSTAHMRKVLDGPVGEQILKALEAQGFIGLAFYDSGSRSFYTPSKEIKSLADVKGMKIRVQQSDMWVSMMQAMGANATPMPYAEVYTALKTGVVDAAENNWPSYESSRHYEVAKVYNLSEHSMAPELLVFSKRIWDTLPKEDQDLIRAAAKESVPFMRKLWDEREAASRKTVEAAGSKIVTVDKKSFQDAMKPVYDKFAGTPALAELVKKIQATAKTASQRTTDPGDLHAALAYAHQCLDLPDLHDPRRHRSIRDRRRRGDAGLRTLRAERHAELGGKHRPGPGALRDDARRRSGRTRRRTYRPGVADRHDAPRERSALGRDPHPHAGRAVRDHDGLAWRRTGPVGRALQHSHPRHFRGVQSAPPRDRRRADHAVLR
jgi:tripartite ATP-independent transporter DctP family solute receptor